MTFFSLSRERACLLYHIFAPLSSAFFKKIALFSSDTRSHSRDFLFLYLSGDFPILALVSSIFNKAKVLSSDKLNDELIKALQHLKIKCVYEAGRENTVKLFILEANILEHLAEIKGDTTKCLLFCHYMEALVAYHRFYGGKD